MTVSFMGYSERGIVNALCDDIVHSEHGIARIGDLLTAIRPGNGLSELRIDEATILVEQGFSDFGDADLVFLLDHTVDGEKKKMAIFVEAKVHTDTSQPKTLRARWREFIRRLEGDTSVKSNLFEQLYRKMRLAKKLTNPGEFDSTDSTNSIATRWSLGANQVIKKAAKKLSEYIADSRFIGLIPDTDERATSVIQNEIENFDSELYTLPEWDATKIGFLTWPAIENICELAQDAWPQTLDTFEWNLGQIYNKSDPMDAPAVNECRLYRDDRVIIRNSSNRRSRWVYLENTGSYFPLSYLSNNDKLQVDDQPQDRDTARLIPRSKVQYDWDPQPGEDFRPSGSEQVPEPPLKIVITNNAGAKSTRVNEVREGGEIIEPSFKVFTHHIRLADPKS